MGRGIQKICEVCKEYDVLKPLYTVKGNDIKIEFFAHEAPKSINQRNVAKDVTMKIENKLANSYESDDSSHFIANSSNNATKRVTKNVTIKIIVLKLINEYGYITTNEIAKVLSLNRRTVQRIINSLKEKGLIVRKGGKRFGYWEIRKQGK